jgi:Acetyltransferase (GNAT) domain
LRTRPHPYTQLNISEIAAPENSMMTVPEELPAAELPLIVERLSSVDHKSEWNRFLRLSPQGSIFATTTYLDALNVRYALYVVRKFGEIDVGLPLVRGVGGMLTNPLFCKYLGVLTRASESKKPSHAASELYRRIDAIGGLLQSCNSYDYCFHPSFDNWLPFHWLGFAQQTLYTYRISCQRRATWWSEADSRLRRSVRRGEKGGITIRKVQELDRADARLSYALCMEPFRQRKSPSPISATRFERLVSNLCPDGSLRVWLAREADGTAAAAAAVLYDWKSSYLLLNGTSKEATTGANSLLIKTIIDDTLERNLDFDFEGSMIRPIESFYRLFGGERTCYYRIWKPTLINAVKRSAFRWARKLGRYER